jgi:hypothetical protein
MGIEEIIHARCKTDATFDEDARDALFVEMLCAFRRSGGLARESEVHQLNRVWTAGCSHEASLSGPIVCFEWGQRLWLPWFQFDPVDMSLRPGPSKVISELSTTFDGWDLAVWFAKPNMWIGNARPIDLIDESLPCVLGAARADRFIAAG